MKRFVLPCLALGFVFFAAGCGDSHEKVVKDSIALMNEMADILEKIKDKDDVDKYKGDLEKLAKKMKELKERGEKLGKPKTDEDERLKKEYEGKVKEASGRLMKSLFGLPPEAQKALKDLDINLR